MAKTRIKTTPSRMQKDALVISATTDLVITTVNAELTEAQKNARKSIGSKERPIMHKKSTILAAVPKRTNSVSSATSSLSHSSEVHLTYSDTDSPPPPPLAHKLQMNPILAPVTTRSLNTVLCKPAVTNFDTLKNRKVFMITEKCDNVVVTDSCTVSKASGHKRKMYLIMEENNSSSADITTIETQKNLKGANGLNGASSVSKKLTLFTDKCNSDVLTQKFEKILPEILNRIQAKSTNTSSTMVKKLYNGNCASAVDEGTFNATSNNSYTQQKTCGENTERLPLTLPPKKNRTKIITHCNSNFNNNNCKSTTINCKSNISSNIIDNRNLIPNGNYNKVGSPCHVQQFSAATPVIVSATALSTISNNPIKNTTNGSHIGSSGVISDTISTPTTTTTAHNTPQKNINLSTDFLFLMKMLPELESIPEPHKTNVKNCVERIITQNANIFAKQ